MSDSKIILKVWIEPGCIICDACETTCPEVFEVKEDSCVVKPEAASPEFLRDKTEAIELAAEECPVEVIRFEARREPL